MRRGESSLCGALMTHKLPHKLPHKTDVGFLEPIRPISIATTAEEGTQMHAFSE